jgi:hypothetical protein
MTLERLVHATRLLFLLALLLNPGVVGCTRSVAETPSSQAKPSAEPGGMTRSTGVGSDEPRTKPAKGTKREAKVHVQPGSRSEGGGDTDRTEATPPLAPEKLADRWFDLLGRKDKPGLTALTALPFTLHDRELKGACHSGVATTSDELPGVLDCIFGNELLAEDLASPYNKPLVGTRLAERDFPKWSKVWKREIEDGLVPVGYGFVGAGVTHEMIVLVTPGGVRAFWRAATYDPN